MAADEVGYSDEETARLELIWGEGFLSPGGPAEIARILGGHDVAGARVLDIGSGAGGAAMTLVREHDAGFVVGVDVQDELVSLAAARTAAAGLDDRVVDRLVEPGPLPLPDVSFDVVFSKDAIIHVADKLALYEEARCRGVSRLGPARRRLRRRETGSRPARPRSPARRPGPRRGRPRSRGHVPPR